MKKLQLAAAVAAMGLSSQAFGYSAIANVQFHWATDGLAIGWTSSAGNTLSAMSNDTYFSALTGNNSTTYYNPDFAKAGDATGWCGPGTESFQAQYACRISPAATPINDIGPGAKATGKLTATETTLKGTLTVITTNDEGKGPQALGLVNGVANQALTAATGYNVRSADGSPFTNVWYGFSNETTLTVDLKGTFDANSWQINGGTVGFFDPKFQCAIADFSGVLCNPGTVGGGFQVNGQGLSWGMSQATGAGTGVGEITVLNGAAFTNAPTNTVPNPNASLLATLSGVLASLTLTDDPAPNAPPGQKIITTNQGETRVGTGLNGSGCPRTLAYASGGITCGTLQVRKLDITGVVPVPASVWLFGSALGLLGVARRKLAA